MQVQSNICRNGGVHQSSWSPIIEREEDLIVSQEDGHVPALSALKTFSGRFPNPEMPGSRGQWSHSSSSVLGPGSQVMDARCEPPGL